MTTAGRPGPGRPSPALQRFTMLAALDADERARLEQALHQTRTVRARREVMVEGRPPPLPTILADGWAARVRLLADGRRQFVSFLLPGDLVGLYRQRLPLATSTIIALTDVAICPAPPAEPGGGLEQVYGVSDAMEEAYLCAHIVRLGRLNAQERISDLLLEFHERLSLAGLVTDDCFEVPLTQEMIGDALGLTSVHVNRMLQQSRHDGRIDWDRGRITLSDPQAQAAQLGRLALRVSAEH